MMSEALLLGLTQLLMLITLASSWNLISGVAGCVDFGHAVFFGVGAYAMGILTTRTPLGFAPGLGFWPALLAAVLASAAYARLLGRLTLRLQGPYFSIAMLGALVATKELVRLARPWTGGGSGLDLPPVLDRAGDLAFMAGLCGGWLGALALLRRSELGLTLLALREDETGAQMRGIDTAAQKTAALVISASVTGAVGAFWAWQTTTLDPDTAFLDSRTLDMALCCLLGGLGTFWGPPLGAALLFGLRELLWSRFLDLHLLLQGGLLMGLVLLLPDGILGRRPR